MIRRAITITYKLGRRIVIAVIGSTILLVGILMLAAPGPAIVVIPIGLAVLGLEFAWARRWLGTLRQTLSNQAARMRINKVNPRIR
ncbi:MAG TPA: PGPGW domain-containing protein [Woeseiaceae bacterium]